MHDRAGRGSTSPGEQVLVSSRPETLENFVESAPEGADEDFGRAQKRHEFAVGDVRRNLDAQLRITFSDRVQLGCAHGRVMLQ